jgi:hypothetical protein
VYQLIPNEAWTLKGCFGKESFTYWKDRLQVHKTTFLSKAIDNQN